MDTLSVLNCCWRGVQIKDNDGWTPLMCASSNGHTECAKLLLDSGADVNIKSNDGWTPLMWASSKGRTECVKLLLECGADTTIVDKDGKTASMLSHNSDITQLLLEYESTSTYVLK